MGALRGLYFFRKVYNAYNETLLKENVMFKKTHELIENNRQRAHEQKMAAIEANRQPRWKKALKATAFLGVIAAWFVVDSSIKSN